jgi:hypothetical protein
VGSSGALDVDLPMLFEHFAFDWCAVSRCLIFFSVSYCCIMHSSVGVSSDYSYPSATITTVEATLRSIVSGGGYLSGVMGVDSADSGGSRMLKVRRAHDARRRRQHQLH